MPTKLKKHRKKIIWAVILLPILLVCGAILYLFANQQQLIQDQIAGLNQTHQGEIIFGKTHLNVFENFPLVSFQVDDVKILENKTDSASLIVDVADIQVGFNVWDIVKGNLDIQSILLEEGVFNLVLHQDGTNNLQNALASIDEGEPAEALHIHLQDIELRNLDIHKLDESTNTDVEAFVYNGKGGFKTESGKIAAHIDTDFLLNIMREQDTTYIHHKHFEVHTDLTFDETTGMLHFKPSKVQMEHGDFNIEGKIDTKNDIDLDLEIYGTKPNFDMLIAFAPEDLIPLLERYDNAGNIYFDARVAGPTLHGQMPLIEADFGASEAFLENTLQHKRINDMGFKGHFGNGPGKDLQSMEFSLTDISAQLEKGTFTGAVVVRNFEQPEVDMQCFADFNLDFLARFLNIKDVVTAAGNVTLDMRFHDIIDLDHPERTLSQVNRAYFTEVKISDLSLASSDLPAPLHKLNAHLIMEGKEANLDLFEIQIGQSDLSATGYISDLPAIVHHTDIPLDVHLDILSDKIDIAELTNFTPKDSIGIDEQLEDVRLGLSFEASARAFTESKHLPVGEFFIDSLHANLKHYPHELHDFHADILIDNQDLKIVDFTGYLDDSDFHFDGHVHDYGFWLQDTLQGSIDLDLSLKSDLLRLEDIFTYQGENYIPEDYRHEELERFHLHLATSMHYRASALQSIDVDLDHLEGKMHVHPLRLENFQGKLHYEDDHIRVQHLAGKMGKTQFDLDLNYYLGDDLATQQRDNKINLKANYIDFDELSNFNLDPPTAQASTKNAPNTADVAEHAEAFNVYELPFSDMQINAAIGHFIYHRIDLRNLDAQLRTTKNHLIYLDTLHMNTAGGSVALSGLFDGTDPKHIFLQPNMRAKGVDLDRLLFKFENFGQDHLVSENLHGKLTAQINGKVRMYPDLVADLDQSEIHLDVEILNGRLQNYAPMEMLADYMGNKDLTNIRFDTLQNHIDLTNGLMTIPSMRIESTLGHMEIAGTQNLNSEIDYQIRIPMKTVSQAARSKLFGKKNKEKEDDTEDEIIKKDDNKKTRYVNIKVTGTTDDFKIGLGKKRE